MTLNYRNFDFTALSGMQFEQLVAALVAQDGLSVQTFSGQADRGIDLVARGDDGSPTFVIVKHTANRTISRQTTHEMVRLRDQYGPDTKGLFATSGVLSASSRAILADSGISVWDRDLIAAKLAESPAAMAAYSSLVRAEGVLASLAATAVKPKSATALTVAEELASVPPGKSHWRDYERVCSRVLTDVFLPELGAPSAQYRSDDGLDIMDAIYPIRSQTGPWARARAEYGCRFVVAEFKNYNEPVGADSVRQIHRYLWPKAFRTFGLLVSRHDPSEQAWAQRRRAWLGDGGAHALIVFISDDDLIAMADMSSQNRDPFELIDAQLEDFFIGLSP